MTKKKFTSRKPDKKGLQHSNPKGVLKGFRVTYKAHQRYRVADTAHNNAFEKMLYVVSSFCRQTYKVRAKVKYCADLFMNKYAPLLHIG